MSANNKRIWKIIVDIIKAATAFVIAIGGLIQLFQSPGDSNKLVSSGDKKPAPQVATVEVVKPVNLQIAKTSAMTSRRSTESASSSLQSKELTFEVIQTGNKYFSKSGYYLKVDEHIRIVPDAINSDSASVKITDAAGSVISEKKMNSTDKLIELTYDGNAYEISLLKTGKAGKNPFNKAAFFEVKKAKL
ncbi:MAG: hypothetical protein V3V05_01060 [Pontiella sp.]